MRLILFLILTLCLLCAAGVVPSGASEYDWATVSGPLPDVPPVNGPVCANCDGAGCSQCQPDTGGDDPVDTTGTVDTTPTTNQTQPPVTNTTQGQTTTVAPVVTVDPQQQFERQKEALLKEFRMPAALTDDIPASSAVIPTASLYDDFGAGSAPVGLSESEWKEAVDCEKALDTLYAKWPLSAADETERIKLEARRSILWKKAISVPGLTAEERDRLRLKWQTLNPPQGAVVPTVSKDTVDKWLKPPSLPAQSQGKPAVPALNPVNSWLVGQYALGQVQGTLELGGELWADQILEEHSFGDFLGVGKIALAYKEGGMSSALAETGNFLVGKIGIPQASIAVEGGRQYANIVYQAQNKFMTDAMKAAGGEFDKEKFWSDFNEDLSIGQKAVKEFIGYGAE